MHKKRQQVMMARMLQKLLDEAGLQLDDIRWYLAGQFAERLLNYRNRKEELIEFIWSKRLESDLYEMEDDYINLIASQLEKNQIDESRVREIVAEIRTARARRYYE